MPEAPPARILIVDDEVPQMRALCDTLKDQGYETAGFSRGRAALAAMKETRFDLLLTDLMMPEMDGIAVLRAALETDANLTGIVMTGEGTIATAVEAMKTGAFDYILKPFKVSAVLPVLSRALSVRRLRVQNAELQERVRERTAELETANRDLEAFSFSVSHDLRAPVRHIGGFSKVLLDDYASQMPEEARHILNLVASSTQRMSQLIDDLLNFSRMGRQPLSKSPVNISEMVQQMIDEFLRESGDRKIEVRVGELPDCVGDPSLLKQVFVNLLSNAFKFTRDRAPAQIEVDCRTVGAETIYSVRDNGAGFNVQYAEKLFSVFQRFHSADQFDGTGVGLSIVQRIIQRHGGRIWAEAAVDKGATFYFTLAPAGTA